MTKTYTQPQITASAVSVDAGFYFTDTDATVKEIDTLTGKTNGGHAYSETLYRSIASDFDLMEEVTVRFQLDKPEGDRPLKRLNVTLVTTYRETDDVAVTVTDETMEVGFYINVPRNFNVDGGDANTAFKRLAGFLMPTASVGAPNWDGMWEAFNRGYTNIRSGDYS